MTYSYRVSVVVLCALILSGASAVMAADAAKGRPLYQQYCSMCHGAQGKGNGPAAAAMKPRPRDHTESAYMNTLSDDHLMRVLADGGQAVNRSPLMPGWKGTLTPAQMRDVIAYLRTLAAPASTP